MKKPYVFYEIEPLSKVYYSDHGRGWMMPAYARCTTIRKAEKWVRKFGVVCEVVRWKNRRMDKVWIITPPYLKPVREVQMSDTWPVKVPFTVK